MTSFIKKSNKFIFTVKMECVVSEWRTEFRWKCPEIRTSKHRSQLMFSILIGSKLRINKYLFLTVLVFLLLLSLWFREVLRLWIGPCEHEIFRNCYRNHFSNFFWVPLSWEFFNGFHHLRMVRPQNADEGDGLQVGKGSYEYTARELTWSVLP